MFSRTLLKWLHTVCDLLRLALLFSQHNAFEIYPSCMYVSIVHSFLFLCSVPWYEYTTACLTIHLQHSLVFPAFSYYKQRWCEQSCTGVFVDKWQSFYSYGTNVQTCHCWAMWNVCSVCTLSNCFLEQVYNFTLQPAIYRRSRFSTSSIWCCHHCLSFSNSSKCVVLSHCGLNLHFTNGEIWPSFLVLICFHWHVSSCVFPIL